MEDAAYYTRRIAEERRAGMSAASEKARQSHFDLATAYQKRLDELNRSHPRKRRSKLHITTAR